MNKFTTLIFYAFFVINCSEKKESKDAVGVIALNYSIPLGAKTSTLDSKADRDFTLKLKSVRSELYKPVQRENRIMKKSIKLGVTVSGY